MRAYDVGEKAGAAGCGSAGGEGLEAAEGAMASDRVWR